MAPTPMHIADRTIAPDHPPYVIAELGVNHDGSADRGVELVESARAAGANAIKLQHFRAEQLLSSAARLADYQRDAGARDPAAMLDALSLSADAMRRLVDHARSVELHVIITIFSVELVPEAEAYSVDAYKAASPDCINRPLLEALMRTDRPLLVSTGAATMQEVERTSDWIKDHPHILMQCVSAYPTADEDASFAGREAMARVNPNALGYSDHTTAVDAGALAVAGGACVLEKHLTYDRAASGPDHAASLDPKQFAEYVRLAHRAWRMRGRVEKRLLDVERDVREASRQSLTTKRAMARGEAIQRDDLAIKRPGTGIEPHLMDDVIGRALGRDVKADMPLVEEDLA